MTGRDDYRPGAAAGATIDENGKDWALLVVRDLRHAPQVVWGALTEPAQLREWAPFDADRDLGSEGPVALATVGGPGAAVAESRVTRAEAHRLLEYTWGGQQLRWRLEPLDGGGTRLTLWHAIDRNYIAMAAAGWQICLDVLERLLAGHPVGRIVGADAMKFDWRRLNAEYSQQFGIATVTPPGMPKE